MELSAQLHGSQPKDLANIAPAWTDVLNCMAAKQQLRQNKVKEETLRWYLNKICAKIFSIWSNHRKLYLVLSAAPRLHGREGVAEMSWRVFHSITVYGWKHSSTYESADSVPAMSLMLFPGVLVQLRFTEQQVHKPFISEM